MGADYGNTLVYSSETGMIKPLKEKKNVRPSAQPVNKPPADGVVRVRRETKGRGGSTVIVIDGLPESSLKEISVQLKKRCGTGGTVKNGIVEIQGDHRETIMTELSQKGFRVKSAGG